jgi:hypothetical protein
MEDTLALRIAIPFAGEREKRASQPNGLRKQVERPPASRKQVGDGLKSPRRARKGRKAPGYIGLSSRWIHELATEGVRAKRIGIMHV